MRPFLTPATRLSAAALFAPLLLLLSSCSRYNSSGGLSIAGILYLILALYCLFSVFQQDWDITKKLIWAAVIFFFPILGSLAYLLFSGRR